MQPFANRADIPGGSTLGNLLSHKVSIPMVDVGLPQLSMHSALETAGCQDVTDMISVFTEFYKSSVIREKREPGSCRKEVSMKLCKTTSVFYYFLAFCMQWQQEEQFWAGFSAEPPV